MRPRLVLTLLAALPLLACDFFKELESEPDAGDTGDDEAEASDDTADTDGDETSSEACTILDEHCENQDTLVSCDPESGELITSDCAALCTNALNFTCTPTDSFAHACWCVTPGDFKLDSCSQLEQCIQECGNPESSCSANCFSRTDTTTIRLLGTLWSCADRACDELCKDSPESCGNCLTAARAGLWGDCGVERSVCDSDQSDDPGWP